MSALPAPLPPADAAPVRFGSAMLRRFGAAEQDDQAHSARARMNLIVLSAFLLWVAFLLCLGGLRAVLVTG